MKRLMFFQYVGSRRSFMVRLYIRFILIGLIVFVINVPPIKAQDITQWASDQRVPGYPDNTHLTPFLIADQNHTVHAFGNQLVGDKERNMAIVYNQWNREKGWTVPIDILLAPSGDAQILGAFLDTKGIMHVVFVGGGGSIYYANAYISRANDASAWSLPIEVGTEAYDPCYGVIAGDNKGNLIILYNGSMDGNGVYAITSNDAGYSWSEPAPIFITEDDQLVSFTINAYMGKSGVLHVVWNILNSTNEFVALYYDRLIVDSNQWDKPVLLDKRPEIKGFFGPAVPFIVDNGLYVVIMYNGGNPYTGQPVPFGRPTLLIQTSSDNGKSWGAPTNPFPFLTGSSGEHSLVIDSNQNIHALALMRIDTLVNGKYIPIGGMWHSELRNNIWSDPERLVTTVQPPLMLRAVVSQGNVLLTTWIKESVTGNGVWYSYTVLDSPELPIVALPIQPERSSLTSTSFPPSPTPSPITASTQMSSQFLNGQGVTYAPAQPLILGIIPVIILILGVVIIAQLRGRRNS